jgi:hypothetical protein
VDDLTATFSNLEIVVSNQEKKETYMSKNLTRKGLALGAIVALGSTFFSGAAAHAAGLADTSFVSLAPTTGTDYAVIAGAGNTFSISANEASTLTTGNIKFLVADTSGLINPSVAFTLATSDSVAVATNVVTITAANSLIAGQKVTFGSAIVNANGTALAAGTYTVSATGLSGTAFKLVELSAATTITSAVLSNTSTVTVQGARATADNSYVVDSGSASSATSSVLSLVSPDAVTRSVAVTAWKDANANDKIDDTEYVSPTRTVVFEKASDLVVSTALAPVIGDQSLTAKITTTPTLNGVQVLATNALALNAAFTRQGSSATLLNAAAAPSTWNDTTKVFSVAISTSAAAGTLANTGDTIAAGGAVTGTTRWTGLTRPLGSAASTVVSAAGVATTTAAGHNLKVGDIVSFGGAHAATGAAATVTVTSVPSTSTFTWASTLTTALTTADTTAYTVETYTGHLGLVDAVFAGAYTAQAYVNGVSAGAVASAGTVAVAAAKATLATTSSASVAGTSAADNTANATAIKTGTTSVPFTLTAVDADGVVVTAGRPVVVSTTSLVTGSAAAVGTFKINGLSSPVTLYTDANGQVSFTLTEALGLSSAQVRVQAVVEGTVTVGADLDWADQSYGLLNLNTTGASLATARAVLKGGSYVLGLAVVDQWFQAPVDGTYRLKTSGSGVTEAFVPLVAGKANVTVTDNGVTSVGSSFVSNVDLQKSTNSVFATVTANAITTTVIAAPTVVLGASGSTLYGSSVVASSAVAAKALVAIDKRSSSTVTPAYANNLVLNGQVQSSTTSVGVAGALVTVSGPANVLFENGQVTKLGSLTALADSNGKFEFKAYSTTAQTDSVVTFTSEGVSKTIKVSFTGVSVGKTNVLTAAAGATTVQAGRAVDYTATVVDAQGNAVSGFALKATLVGAGYFAGSVSADGSAALTTDVNGKAVVKVLFSSNDQGTATVTFADNDASTATADNLKSVVLATEVGSTDANIDIVGKRVTAVTSFSKGKTVAFYVDGIKKWSKVSTSDADVVLYYNLKKGTHTVTVKVSGGFTTTEKFIVK